MNWLKVSATVIRDPRDTVRVHKIADGWFRVYRVVKNIWREGGDFFGEDAATKAKMKAAA